MAAKRYTKRRSIRSSGCGASTPMRCRWSNWRRADVDPVWEEVQADVEGGRLAVRGRERDGGAGTATPATLGNAGNG